MCKSLLVFPLLVFGGKVIGVPVALPASTSANTPAQGNQRFHLRTESLWIPVTKPGFFYAYVKKKKKCNYVSISSSPERFSIK